MELTGNVDSIGTITLGSPRGGPSSDERSIRGSLESRRRWRDDASCDLLKREQNSISRDIERGQSCQTLYIIRVSIFEHEWRALG